MALFGKKESAPQGLIGVDIGAGGIKAVELIPEKGRARLATYGYSELKNPQSSGTPLLDDAKAAGAMLADVVKQSGMHSLRANASLPSYAVFHAIITIPQPKDAKEDVKALIEARVKKLLPLPLEDMILDSTIIDKELMPKKLPSPKERKKKKGKKEITPAPQEVKKEKNQKPVRVLVSGAPKELVQKYVAVFKQAKLQLSSLETEAFALIRSLVGKDKSRILIIDVGYERTNMTIVQGGIPFLHRSIKAGGSDVTAMLSKQMGVSALEAEQTKLDLAHGAGKDIPPVLKEAMMPILHEAKYSLELYGQQQFGDGGNIEKIIVTGGSARLPQIDPFLTEALNINVYIGDPWARVATPPGLRPVLDEIGPRFSVAVGLAMKGVK